MPNYSTESIGNAEEYVIYNSAGRYSIGTVYNNTGCVSVYDNQNGATVGCFQCAGAQNSCSSASECSNAEVIEIPANTRVRTSEDTDTSDIDFCSPPYTGDYNGFCLSSSYPQTGVYSYNAATGTYTRGNVKLYFTGERSGTCRYSLNNTSGPYCISGYYLNNGKCLSCPNGAASGVAGYHSLPQASACKSPDGGDSEICTSGQYDLGQYFSDVDGTKCISCPAGAKCNGEQIFCPAGSFIYYPGDDATYPSCVKCPGAGMAQNVYYTDTLQSCNGDPEAYGKGISSDCKWTDYVYDDLTSCYAYRGSDETGTYEFRSPSGEWDYCYYTP